MAGPNILTDVFAARKKVVESGEPGYTMGPAASEWYGATEQAVREIRYRSGLDDIEKGAWVETLRRASYDNGLDLESEATRIINAIQRVQEALRPQPPILLYHYWGNETFGEQIAQLARAEPAGGLHVYFDDLRTGDLPWVYIGVAEPVDTHGSFSQVFIDDIETAACTPDEAVEKDIAKMLGDDPNHRNFQLVIGEEAINIILGKVITTQYDSPETLRRARFLVDQVMTQCNSGAHPLQTGVASV